MDGDDIKSNNNKNNKNNSESSKSSNGSESKNANVSANASTKQEYEARAQKVRLSLKQWEADFAKSHGGRKPSREDIKNNPSIAQKYKDYNRLRDVISGKAPAPATSSSSRREAGSSTKRKPDAPSPVETPLKKSKHFATPSKGQAHVDGNGFMLSPAVSRKLFSPAAITCLGPTPQRDGKVLGLFDLLVEKELGISPHKPTPQGLIRGGGGGGGGGVGSGSGSGSGTGSGQNTQATPRKRRGSQDDTQGARLGQTPSSSRRRGIGTGAGTFATPHKKKDGAEPGTPSSVSRLNFDTPAFLKRQKMPTLDENAAFDAPAPLRLPRKPFARGLSEIITSLRKVEDEQADEDLEALREAMSGELDLGTSVPQKAQAQATGPTTKDKARGAVQPAILKPDTDRPQLLGGFDDEGLYDSPVEEQDGRPTRVYKKKGQKRTTRRVNIKPTRHKRPVGEAGSEDQDESGAEAEQQEEEERDSGAEDEEASDPDFVDDDGGDDDDDAPKRHKARIPAKSTTKQKVEKEEKGKGKEKEEEEEKEKEGPVKKATRKVDELAHTNFQRLKLRNHGAKGGPGHNSRFRRRR